MPYIKITETEENQFNTFDVTENTVLVPMLYARAYNIVNGNVVYTETDQDCEAKLYRNANTFKKAMSSGSGVNLAKPRFVYTEAGKPDRAYVMAYELLLQGLNVVIKPVLFDNAYFAQADSEGTGDVIVDEVAAQTIIDHAITVDNCLEEFKNRNLFNIKFITSGGYPNYGKVTENVLSASSTKNAILFEIDSASERIEKYDSTNIRDTLVNVCSWTDNNRGRGDAIALLDLEENILTKDELIEQLNAITTDDADRYAAAFFPWCTFETSVMSSIKNISMPGSFAYLMAYANSINTNANWFAASGVIRGFVPNMVKPNFNVGEALMHLLQGDAGWYDDDVNLGCRVNPIYNAGTYGYRIWGNRVFKPKDSEALKDQYLEFLNVRILLCDIKKQIFHAAMRTTFEPNDDIVWINFKSLCNSLLDTMKSGRGLVWYKWTKEKSVDDTGAQKLGLIKATLTIKPIEAVESFDVNVYLTDEEAEVTE